MSRVGPGYRRKKLGAWGRGIFIEVPRPPQLLSLEGEKVIISGIAVGLLTVLVIGFATLRAPILPLLVPVPLILLAIFAVRKDLGHVRRYGWGTTGGEGPNSDGGIHKTDEPPPPGPSGDGEQFDWEGFVTQFWEHVDREPVA